VGPIAGGAGAGAIGTAIASSGVTDASEAIANAISSVVDAVEDKLVFKFVTYTRMAPDGTVYSGRTSGFGNPQAIVNARAAGHPGRLAGFGPPRVDEVASGVGGYAAIRGREQQLIDVYGKAKSEGGTSANLIRGVAKSNPFGFEFWKLSNDRFGPLGPFTGYRK
jgi:hypothetical protein